MMKAASRMAMESERGDGAGVMVWLRLEGFCVWLFEGDSTHAGPECLQMYTLDLLIRFAQTLYRWRIRHA